MSSSSSDAEDLEDAFEAGGVYNQPQQDAARELARVLFAAVMMEELEDLLHEGDPGLRQKAREMGMKRVPAQGAPHRATARVLMAPALRKLLAGTVAAVAHAGGCA